MSQINDDLYAFLISEGIPAGHINDMQYDWLILQGIPAGHLNDMWALFNIRPVILNSALVLLDSTTMTISGSDITNWINKGTGGATYDMIGRTSAALLPQTLLINGINVADISISPTRNWFTPAASTLISQPYTVVTVAKQNSQPTAQHVLFDGIAAGNRGFMQVISTENVQGFSGNVLTTGPNVATLTAGIYTMVADGAVNGRIRQSDVFDLSGNIGIANWDYGTLGANLNTFNGWNGWIGAHIVFDIPLTTQNIIDIENYYKGIYNI